MKSSRDHRVTNPANSATALHDFAPEIWQILCLLTVLLVIVLSSSKKASSFLSTVHPPSSKVPCWSRGQTDLPNLKDSLALGLSALFVSKDIDILRNGRNLFSIILDGNMTDLDQRSKVQNFYLLWGSKQSKQSKTGEMRTRRYRLL
jgi:hypothetical protein